MLVRKCVGFEEFDGVVWIGNMVLLLLIFGVVIFVFKLNLIMVEKVLVIDWF